MAVWHPTAQEANIVQDSSLMPRSLQPPGSSGAQLQVGRAGRDGCEAACTAFLDDGDFLRLRSLAHADGTDQPNVHSFLEAVFAKPASAGGTKVPTSQMCTAFRRGVIALPASTGGATVLTRPNDGTHHRVPGLCVCKALQYQTTAVKDEGHALLQHRGSTRPSQGKKSGPVAC